MTAYTDADIQAAEVRLRDAEDDVTRLRARLADEHAAAKTTQALSGADTHSA